MQNPIALSRRRIGRTFGSAVQVGRTKKGRR